MNHDRGSQAGGSVTQDRSTGSPHLRSPPANPQRHMDFDGSDMLRGAVIDRPISGVGYSFTMKMNRLGRDHLMLNDAWSSSRIAASFGNPLRETSLRRAVIHPESAPLRVTPGATSSLGTVTTPPSSPRSLASTAYRRRSVKPSRGGRGVDQLERMFSLHGALCSVSRRRLAGQPGRPPAPRALTRRPIVSWWSSEHNVTQVPELSSSS